MELKRQFLDDELKKNKGSGTNSMTGTKWYGLEAFRATNQAIGRVIRHSRYNFYCFFFFQLKLVCNLKNKRTLGKFNYINLNFLRILKH